jgi:hypothetical protein
MRTKTIMLSGVIEYINCMKCNKNAINIMLNRFSFFVIVFFFFFFGSTLTLMTHSFHVS